MYSTVFHLYVIVIGQNIFQVGTYTVL